MSYPGLNDAESKALDDSARQIGTPGQYLWEVMNFESRLNPKATGPLLKDGNHPRGLIQFMPSTAKSLGFASGDDLVNKYPTFEAQVRGPVVKYFKTLGASFPTRQALYMSVFFPAAKGVPADTTFENLYKEKNLKGYATFAAENPGIKTVADYVNKTMAAAQNKLTSKTLKVAAFGGMSGLILLGVAGWFFFINKPSRASRKRTKG